MKKYNLLNDSEDIIHIINKIDLEKKHNNHYLFTGFFLKTSD
jgi:predicted GTPase